MPPALPAGETALLDAFCDTLWLEHGLSRNTLAGYRSDLSLYATWLVSGRRDLAGAARADIAAYLAEFSARAKPASQRRLISALRRFYRHLLVNGRIAADPTLHIDLPTPTTRFPKTLTETQVETLLAAPDTATPLGLRDRAMLELLYATGLRVSELVAPGLFLFIRLHVFPGYVLGENGADDRFFRTVSWPPVPAAERGIETVVYVHQLPFYFLHNDSRVSRGKIGVFPAAIKTDGVFFNSRLERRVAAYNKKPFR